METETNYYFEFGILAVDGDEDELLNQEPEPTRATIDIRQIAIFSESKDVEGPDGKIYDSITHITFYGGDQVGIFYPYLLFKKLYQQQLGIKIQSLPYPD